MAGRGGVFIPGVRFFRNTQNWATPTNGLATNSGMFHVVPAPNGGITYDCEFADMDQDEISILS